jgi:hypothetical protein
MNWFRRKPTQQKYVEAAITVASNLYLQTIPKSDGTPAPLHFTLPDSRYRYMIFCVSTVVTAALVYDERKEIQPEALINGCLQFLTWLANERPDEYFDNPANAERSINSTTASLQEFLKQWSRWPEFEKEGKSAESNELISHMLRTTESDLPAETEDLRRLGNLALDIDSRMPTMRRALVDLANRKS